MTETELCHPEIYVTNKELKKQVNNKKIYIMPAIVICHSYVVEHGWWQLLAKPAKRLKTTCFDKCIFCQTSDDVLRTAKLSSIEKVISAFEVRQDEVSQRLSADDLRHTCMEGNDIMWHSSCYETYTSKQNLRYYSSQSIDVQADAREQRTSFDWSARMQPEKDSW